MKKRPSDFAGASRNHPEIKLSHSPGQCEPFDPPQRRRLLHNADPRLRLSPGSGYSIPHLFNVGRDRLRPRRPGALPAAVGPGQRLISLQTFPKADADGKEAIAAGSAAALRWRQRAASST
jgi:hypothetical protein